MEQTVSVVELLIVSPENIDFKIVTLSWVTDASTQLNNNIWKVNYIRF